jgi:hypothetical protein
MKVLFIILANFLPLTGSHQDSKLDLICQKWVQVGIKNFGKEYKSVDKSLAKNLLLKKDGAYEEGLYKILIKGQWKFNNDSTKLAFALMEMNGKPMSGLTINDYEPYDSIFKLTKDTLIYGSAGLHGQQRIYGYTVLYFVKEK